MAADERPTVSVIVPVRDGLPALVHCVERLIAQDYPADLYEILVVDNGSATSPAARLPRDQRVICMAESKPGSYAARNAALARASGEVMAFTDADCLPAEDWLTESVRALTAEEGISMVGGRIELTFGGGRPRTGPEWYEYAHGFPQEAYVREGGFAATANMVTWRKTFADVGPFDDSLRSGGDGEWGRRVRAAGKRQEYAPRAVVRHPARVAWSELHEKHRRTTLGVIDRTPAGESGNGALLRGAAATLVRTLADVGRSLATGAPNGAGRRLRYVAARLFVGAVTAWTLVSTALGPGRRSRR